MRKQTIKPKIAIIILAVLTIIFVLVYFNTRTAQQIKEIYILPDSLLLNEISGISYYNNDIVVAEQDNLGDIFFYDLKQKTVIKRISVAPPGDFEDIAIANNNFYLLRSDGSLFELSNYPSHPTTTEYKLKLGATNNEGLAYDERTNSLLISTKSNVDNVDPQMVSDKNERWIYSFDLNTKKLNTEPFLILKISDIQQYIQNSKIEINPKKNNVEFRPSGLAIEPNLGYLYIISSVDNMLAIVNRQGKIISIRQLDLNNFNKPEGITFATNGDILISNEGGKGLATIVRLQKQYGK